MLGGAALAGAVALTLTAATGASAAANYSFSEGHVDVVHVGFDSTGAGAGLGLFVGNEGDPAYAEGVYAAADSQFEVTDTPALGGFVLPENPDVADANGVLFAGFSGSGDLIESGIFGYGDQISVTLEDWDFVPAAGESAGATFLVEQQSSSDIFFDGTGDVQDFTVNALDAPEAFHEHATWTFEKAGTYTFDFTAEGNGLAADLTPFTFVVG
ncbi:hypothetical protein D6T64_06985 [Cryobacterium melibiosiphilum]|uniref:Surface-anchored protein n=1 Tax=Cryobacterium melibiosiphilum TaxID=995039 RepID=A0A3A5MR04_9MICO|nr:hypothetical protein [Cryobacterium melibiosiphilum]RJT88671.1 hypothetical protein D6T64_09950 [Cryobacterium melibiosiphilum]RJT89433.1 hypothetical protein D6T64_06985 [Cryobacterium melibiosiphilum]